MNIGEFKNVDGQLLGFISTATIHLPRLGLRPVVSNHPDAPKFEVVTLNPGRRWAQIGALWEAKASKTGEFFLQGSVDDPSFTAPLPIACFGTVEEGYRAAWNRRRRRADGLGQSDGQMDAMGGTGQSGDMGEGDGFEGNADANGALIPGAEGQSGGEGEGEPQNGRRGRKAGQNAEEAAPAF